MNWLKKNLSMILLVLVFFIGLCLLLYPSVSDYRNSLRQSKAMAAYVERVDQIENPRDTGLLQDAQRYNASLAELGKANWQQSEEELAAYHRLLDVSGTGVMCSIEIPKIQVNLPVYHGTDEAVLQIAVGHIPGSSLPVGGEGTHCVLSGHRGLPSARLFTDLDQMEVGDTFLIHVLDEVLTYQVDRILTVEPDDLSSLEIIPGEDLVTLVTCTPYGINTHRLLVRGHRIETTVQTKTVSADRVQITPALAAPVAAAAILLVLLLCALLPGKKRHDKGSDNLEKP